MTFMKYLMQISLVLSNLLFEQNIKNFEKCKVKMSLLDSLQAIETNRITEHSRKITNVIDIELDIYYITLHTTRNI